MAWGWEAVGLVEYTFCYLLWFEDVYFGAMHRLLTLVLLSETRDDMENGTLRGECEGVRGAVEHVCGFMRRGSTKIFSRDTTVIAQRFYL